jgi:hypothetical protein
MFGCCLAGLEKVKVVSVGRHVASRELTATKIGGVTTLLHLTRTWMGQTGAPCDHASKFVLQLHQLFNEGPRHVCRYSCSILH